MSSTGRPSSPPFLLTSSFQICMASSAGLPLAERPPVRAIPNPILIGSAARATGMSPTAATRTSVATTTPINARVRFMDSLRGDVYYTAEALRSFLKLDDGLDGAGLLIVTKPSKSVAGTCPSAFGGTRPSRMAIDEQSMTVDFPLSSATAANVGGSPPVTRGDRTASKLPRTSSPVVEPHTYLTA